MNTSILTGLFIILCGVATLWGWKANVTIPRSNKVLVILMILGGVLMLAVAVLR